MQLDLFGYLYAFVDFDWFSGYNFTESFLYLLTLVLTCIVAFLPIGLIIKVIKGFD